MHTSNFTKQKLSVKNIQRAIWIVLAFLVATLMLFGGYYYWDRYIHIGDKSPIELDVEALEQAIRDDPQNPEKRVALAEYYLDKGEPQKAFEQSNQVLKLYPENENAMLIAGLSAVQMEQPETALPPLEKFVAARKDQPMAKTDNALETAYYFLGESYLKLERPDDAIAALEAALTIKRTDADALYQLGQAYQSVGQPEAALERYQQAVRLVPDFSEAYSGMIESYTALNQPDYVAYARGMQAFTLQDWQTAKTHLEYATQALPDFAPAFLGLGLTYEKLGDMKAAQTAIEKSIQLDKNNFAAQQALGRIQATLNAGE